MVNKSVDKKIEKLVNCLTMSKLDDKRPLIDIKQLGHLYGYFGDKYQILMTITILQVHRLLVISSTLMNLFTTR